MTTNSKRFIYSLLITAEILLTAITTQPAMAAKRRTPAQDPTTQMPQETQTAPNVPDTAGVPHANPSTGGTDQVAQRPIPAPQYYDPFEDKKSMFLVSGYLDVTGQNVKVGTSTTEYKTATNQSAYEVRFLREVNENVWFGPSANWGYKTTTAGTAESDATVWQFAGDLRLNVPSKGNSYFALGGFLGWAFVNESDKSDGAVVKGSYSGMIKGAYLGLGNKVGEHDTFLIETLIGFGSAGLSGTYSTAAIENSVTKFYVQFGIGKLF